MACGLCHGFLSSSVHLQCFTLSLFFDPCVMVFLFPVLYFFHGEGGQPERAALVFNELF